MSYRLLKLLGLSDTGRVRGSARPFFKFNDNGTLDAKVLLVGDDESVKSDVVWAFHYKMPCETGALGPTLGDEPVLRVQNGSGAVNLKTVDSTGGEQEGLLRSDYRNTSMIAFIFSLDDPASLTNIEDKWIPQATHYSLGVPSVIIGCKMGTRDQPSYKDSSKTFVTTEEGVNFAKRVGAWRYVECDARRYVGIEELGQCLGSMAWEIYHQQKKKRNVLQFKFSSIRPTLCQYPD